MIHGEWLKTCGKQFLMVQKTVIIINYPYAYHEILTHKYVVNVE